MLRLCARRLASSSRLLYSPLIATPHLTRQAPARFASVSTVSVNAEEIPVLSNPHELATKNELDWEPIINFHNDWYDGRDTLHCIHDKDPAYETGRFRGVSFYNRGHEWQGCVRWCESLRGGPPSVWVHWMGRDPVEIANTLPAPDANGRYCWSMTFTTRQFILYCNNELVGTRDNMLYQYKHVHKAWFSDFEHLNGQWAIEGSHTGNPYSKHFQDIDIFRTFSKQWNLFMNKKRETDAAHAKHNSWRGGEVRE